MSNENKKSFYDALPSLAGDIRRATQNDWSDSSYDHRGDDDYDRNKVDRYMSTGYRRRRRW